MKTMQKRISLTSILLLIALAATPVIAQTDQELEVFRADLLTYVGEISRLPSNVIAPLQKEGQSVADAEASVRELTYEELRPMYATLNRVPYWRGLPQILKNSVTKPEAVPTPLELAAALNRPPGVDPEFVRAHLLTLTRTFASVPREYVSAEYHGRVQRIEAEIRKLDVAQVLELQSMIQQRIPDWKRQLDRTPGANAAGRPVTVLSDCGSGSLTAILCEFGNVMSEIGAIPGKVLVFAADAVFEIINGILKIFTDLVDLIPTPEELVQSIGLLDANWGQIAQTVGDNLRLPCPSQGTVIPGFGPTGEMDTWLTWAQTAGFLGNMIADVTPGDILTSVDAQAVAQVANFPIQWLSRCLENAYNDNYEAAESENWDLVQENLDVFVSTRASQESVGVSLAATADIDDDVARAEAKLDAIEAKADAMLSQQHETIDFLAEWKSSFLRQLIEADLFRQANTRIALFQLPASVGGYLEMAGAIVSDTIARRGAAGLNMQKASAEYAKGVAELGRANYKDAYTFFRSAYQRAVN